ncbi:MAG: hypothetical protein JO246_06270 [Frankiaceae bacterium]|nr:hypothetical protein [Frankiaceae bacterium]
MRSHLLWVVAVLALVTVTVAAPATASARTGHRTSTRSVPHHVVRVGRHAVERFAPRGGGKHEFDTNVLDAGDVKLTSSTGLPLHVNVFVDQFSDGTAGNTGTILEVGVYDRHGEDHLWSVDVGRRAFLWDSLSQAGTVHSGEQLGPLGKVRLSVTADGKPRTTTCPSGRHFVQTPVKVWGEVQVDSQSAAWGVLGNGIDRLYFKGHPSLEQDYGQIGDACQGFGSRRCDGSAEAVTGGAAGFLDAEGFAAGNGTPVGTGVFFDHPAQMPDGVEGFADDFATPFLDPLTVKRHGATKRVTLTGDDTGLITGSATWASKGKPHKEPGVCRGGVAKRWSAAYTNGDVPLTVTFGAGGTYSFPDSGHDAQLMLRPLVHR